MDTIGGFNEFVQTQQRDNTNKTTCSLTTFSYDSENVYSMVDLANMEPLTVDNYVPCGGTALFDAWAATMLILSGQIAKMPTEERPQKILFVVITDGVENSSRRYSHEQVNDMIKSHPDWEFVYLAANQDAIKTGQKYGIGQNSSINYQQGAELSAYKCLNDAVSRYRKGESQRVNFTQYERSMSMDPPQQDSTVKEQQSSNDADVNASPNSV